jgi:hypothetical protein
MTSQDEPQLCWVVTDGRAGNERQSMALAEAVARIAPLAIVRKRAVLREPWRRLPYFAIGDPFSRLAPMSDALSPPLPAVWIGCGRATTALTIAAKRKNPAIFTIQLQDPRAPLALFDLVIPPLHDRLAGGNVFSIIGAPVAIAAPSAPTEGGKRVAALIGGPNRSFRLGVAEAALIGSQLSMLAKEGADLVVTTSRRTPASAADALQRALGDVSCQIWRADLGGPGANPYPGMLADADFIFVTEDSVNMAVEAASTGKPVYVLPLARRRFASAAKFDAFHESLVARGATRRFSGTLDRWQYEPIDETARAASEAVRRWRDASRSRVR